MDVEGSGSVPVTDSDRYNARIDYDWAPEINEDISRHQLTDKSNLIAMFFILQLYLALNYTLRPKTIILFIRW